MGLAKNLYTRKNNGEKIVYDPQPRKSLVTEDYKIIRIPDGILNVNEIEAPVVKKKKKRVNVKQQVEIIKHLEKKIKNQNRAKTLIKTASIKDIQKALGKKYTVERDRSYKCRRWIVTNGVKEWYIRYNDPLCCAIIYIEEFGAAKFLKTYSMVSKYN